MKLKTITRYRQEGDNYYVYLELFMSNKGGAIYMDVPIINSMLKHFDITAPTITTVDRLSLITADKFIMNPQYTSPGGSIDKPCFTLIARMDKMPPYLVSTEKGSISIIIHESDTPVMRKIKEFMSIYGVVDIKMRMLNIRELKRIMGFDSDYTLIGTQAEQKKYIGNAVEVNMSKALCVALFAELNYNRHTEEYELKHANGNRPPQLDFSYYGCPPPDLFTPPL